MAPQTPRAVPNRQAPSKGPPVQRAGTWAQAAAREGRGAAVRPAAAAVVDAGRGLARLASTAGAGAAAAEVPEVDGVADAKQEPAARATALETAGQAAAVGRPFDIRRISRTVILRSM